MKVAEKAKDINKLGGSLSEQHISVASISRANVLTEHLMLAKHHLLPLEPLNLAPVPITSLK